MGRRGDIGARSGGRSNTPALTPRSVLSSTPGHVMFNFVRRVGTVEVEDAE